MYHHRQIHTGFASVPSLLHRLSVMMMMMMMTMMMMTMMMMAMMARNTAQRTETPVGPQPHCDAVCPFLLYRKGHAQD
jgi:hypothetical protein